MSALRKAGVWLGLIEDDDDRGYGYDERTYDDDYPDDEVGDPGSMVRARVQDRLAEARAERTAARRDSDRQHADHRSARDRYTPDDDYGDDLDEPAERRAPAVRAADPDNLRPLTRPTAAQPAASHPVRDNLALAPEPVVAAAVAPRPPIEDDHRYQITTLHPTTFNDARTVGEHFRDGVPVIMNLTEMIEGDAKRVVDFAAGLAFGLRGTMERVTNRVFLLSPPNVRVTDEDRAKIAESGFLHQ
jgi:cell division inhibitor SepF